jgi:hypothetical protein
MVHDSCWILRSVSPKTWPWYFLALLWFGAILKFVRTCIGTHRFKSGKLSAYKLFYLQLKSMN